MYSSYQRINNISAFVSSCLMGLLVAISVASYVQLWSIGEPGGVLAAKPSRFVRGISRSYSRKEQDIGHYKFDVQADLTPLFTWNTKQLFVYIIADYTNEKGITNQVVVWDRIVRRKRDAKLNIESGRSKYSLRDPSLTFRNASPANFTLQYNVMPWIGGLTYGTSAVGAQPVPFTQVATSV